MSRLTLLALAVCVPWTAVPSPAAETASAAELLPPTTLVYVEIANPPRLVGTILDHPLRARLEQLDEYKAATQQKEYLAFQGVLQYVEGRIGMEWREALEALTAEGITLAFDPATQGVALLVHARDEETLDKLRHEFVALAREEARKKGKDDPISEHDYRGIAVYQVKGGGYATVGRWLVLVNNKDLGTGLLDRLLDGGDSLGSNPRFAEAAASRGQAATAWGWVDVEVLRQAQADKGDPFKTQTDNPVAELLIGGLLDTAQHAPWLTASLAIETDRLALSFAMPHQQEWVTESRGYFFGPDGDGAAPPAPDLDGLLFSLSSYRDISQMWLRAGDLFNEKVVDELAAADSNLATLFSGKDFGEEILGAFQPQVQFLATRQSFDESRPIPAIKLPSFAILFQMREPEVTRPEMRRTFQSLIGFLNVVGAMNGQPQLELGMQQEEAFELVTSTYIPERGKETDDQAAIQFNFSPTVGFAGDRFVLASTSDLARQLTTGATPAESNDGSTANTAAVLNAPALSEVLSENREQLISKNMLEKGHSREEAEREIGVLLKIVSLFRDASLQLDFTHGRAALDIEFRLQPLE